MVSTPLTSPKPTQDGFARGDYSAYLVPIESIEILSDSPRKDYDAEQMEDLIADIKQKGMLLPLLVQKAPSFNAQSNKYILHSGHRRLLAAIKVGLKEVPIRIFQCKNEEEKVAIQLSENLQRKDLHPIEVALLLRKFFELGYKEKEIAERVSKSIAWVSKYKKISRMPKIILEDSFALQTTLSDLLALESNFPKHTDLCQVWEIYKKSSLKHALQWPFDQQIPPSSTEDLAPQTPLKPDRFSGITREFLIVTKNKSVINCKMQVSDSEEKDVRVILPKQYSVDEIKDIFEKIIQSINT